MRGLAATRRAAGRRVPCSRAPRRARKRAARRQGEASNTPSPRGRAAVGGGGRADHQRSGRRAGTHMVESEDKPTTGRPAAGSSKIAVDLATGCNSKMELEGPQMEAREFASDVCFEWDAWRVCCKLLLCGLCARACVSGLCGRENGRSRESERGLGSCLTAAGADTPARRSATQLPSEVRVHTRPALCKGTDSGAVAFVRHSSSRTLLPSLLASGRAHWWRSDGHASLMRPAAALPSSRQPSGYRECPRGLGGTPKRGSRRPRREPHPLSALATRRPGRRQEAGFRARRLRADLWRLRRASSARPQGP